MLSPVPGSEGSVGGEVGSEDSVTGEVGSEDSAVGEVGSEDSVVGEVGSEDSVASEVGSEDSVVGEVGSEDSVCAAISSAFTGIITIFIVRETANTNAVSLIFVPIVLFLSVAGVGDCQRSAFSSARVVRNGNLGGLGWDPVRPIELQTVAGWFSFTANMNGNPVIDSNGRV